MNGRQVPRGGQKGAAPKPTTEVPKARDFSQVTYLVLWVSVCVHNSLLKRRVCHLLLWRCNNFSWHDKISLVCNLVVKQF